MDERWGRGGVTGAILGVYELNRIEYLRDVFAWGYQRSCQRYSVVRRPLGEPDPLRMTYREVIRRYVREVVVRGGDRAEAARWIAE